MPPGRRTLVLCHEHVRRKSATVPSTGSRSHRGVDSRIVLRWEMPAGRRTLILCYKHIRHKSGIVPSTGSRPHRGVDSCRTGGRCPPGGELSYSAANTCVVRAGQFPRRGRGPTVVLTVPLPHRWEMPPGRRTLVLCCEHVRHKSGTVPPTGSRSHRGCNPTAVAIPPRLQSQREGIPYNFRKPKLINRIAIPKRHTAGLG